jgi:hypothetical protein
LRQAPHCWPPERLALDKDVWVTVFPICFQIDPVPDAYAGDVAFDVVVEVADEIGAETMEAVEADGHVSTWLIVPVENRGFYQRLEERLASRGLTPKVRSTASGLQIGE